MQVILDRLDRIESALKSGLVSRWLTMKGACDYVHKSPNTIRKWMDKGLIYGTKTTGEWLIDRESIDDYLELDKF
jgi:excisionase family DNA binding protein